MCHTRRSSLSAAQTLDGHLYGTRAYKIKKYEHYKYDTHTCFLMSTSSATSLPLLGHHPRYLSIALTLRARGLVNVGQKLRLKISTRARRYRGEKPTLKVKRRGKTKGKNISLLFRCPSALPNGRHVLLLARPTRKRPRPKKRSSTVQPRPPPNRSPSGERQQQHIEEKW